MYMVKCDNQSGDSPSGIQLIYKMSVSRRKAGSRFIIDQNDQNIALKKVKTERDKCIKQHSVSYRFLSKSS